MLLALGRLAWRVRLPAAPVAVSGGGEQRLINLPRTWLLIARFGIINSGYGIVVAWLAPAQAAAGWSAQQGGELVAWLALAQTASGLLPPPAGDRSAGRTPPDGTRHRLAAGGFGGLWLAPTSAPFSGACCVAPGLGSFPIMVIALDHLLSPAPRRLPLRPDAGVGFMVAPPAWVAARLHNLER